ncbi:MAG: THUMP domain-containing protein [Nitrosotalea sp.]
MEEEAVNEISKLLQVIGDIEPKIEISEFSGIITVNTSLNPFEVVGEIRKKILDEPWSVRYCHRFIPIQETTETVLEEIVKAVQKHVNTMKLTDSYRITIEKRGSDLSSKDMIDAIVKIIHNKVSLEKFDWNVIIEVLGGTSGISVIKEQDMVSTLKIKRDSME